MSEPLTIDEISPEWTADERLLLVSVLAAGARKLIEQRRLSDADLCLAEVRVVAGFGATFLEMNREGVGHALRLAGGVLRRS